MPITNSLMEERGFSSFQHTAEVDQLGSISRRVYTKGQSGPLVLILQELPGIDKYLVALAENLIQEGYRVAVPHLVGPVGKRRTIANTARICISKEFRVFERNASSPIVDWLRNLCSKLAGDHHQSKIGLIGMCLTGNFAISLISEPAVYAAVSSQPSLPFLFQSCLHLSDDQVQATKDSLQEKGKMYAFRYEKDRICTARKFSSIDQQFNEEQRLVDTIQFEGKGHSVLTKDFLDKEGQPRTDALQRTLNYFDQRLR
jgi:dienelactone hydrolase